MVISVSKFERNLTEGNVLKQLVVFSLPFLVSTIVQSLYNVADMLIVGVFSGTNSMAGVNIGGQVTLILTNIVIGLCTGGTVMIAQYLGAKDKKAMQETIATLMTLLLFLSIAITVVMLFLKEPVLHLIQTPKEAFEESDRYLTVTVIGTIFITGYNVLSAIMRGMGDSKRPFYFVLVACVTNIVLDLVLVAVFDMGAFGAAVATVFSQFLSMVLCIIYLIKNNFAFDFNPKSFKIYRNKLSMLIKIGLPSAVQNGVTSFSFLVITALVNSIGGVNASAAVGVVGKFNGFAILPALAMSMSISTMAAQNIGAGKWDRALKAAKIGTLISVCCSYAIFAVAQIFPEAILTLFNKDPEVIACGVTYMRTFSYDYLFVPVLFGFNGLFVGAGKTAISLINGLLSSIVLRVPGAAILGVTFGMGLFGVGLGAPLASAGSLIFAICYFVFGKWKTNNVVTENSPEYK